MKLFYKGKDGGSESSTTGYWLIECKSLFSIVLLKFEGISRDAFHTHVFHSLSWVVKGELQEKFKSNYKQIRLHSASWIPFITRKEDFHKVNVIGTAWALSFRGPWQKQWLENTPQDGTYGLVSGRLKVPV